jgi:hypothetical protein
MVIGGLRGTGAVLASAFLLSNPSYSEVLVSENDEVNSVAVSGDVETGFFEDFLARKSYLEMYKNMEGKDDVFGILSLNSSETDYMGKGLSLLFNGRIDKFNRFDKSNLRVGVDVGYSHPLNEDLNLGISFGAGALSGGMEGVPYADSRVSLGRDNASFGASFRTFGAGLSRATLDVALNF